MSITATELKINLGKYLMLAETEDIYITRNGKVVAKLSNPYQKLSILNNSLLVFIQFHFLPLIALIMQKVHTP